jgi:predicted Rdx family selenoprotein
LDHFKGDEFVGGRIAVIRRTDAGWSKPKSITKLVGGPRADWHMTDDLIVFCTNDVGSVQVTDEPSNLFTVRSDGSKLTQITDYGPGKERASQPTWTADGRIIFDHITGADDELGTVAFINSDGSGLEIAVGNELIGESNRPHHDCDRPLSGLPAFPKLVTNNIKPERSALLVTTFRTRV